MRRCKLGDIAELTVGFVGNMTKEYTEHGIPFLRSLNIKPFMIDDSDLMYITERFNTVLKKSALHTGDIVIVRTGIPGTCCVIPEEYDNTNCADMVIVRTNEVNPYFLAGYINFWGQKQIRSQKVGAVQKHFNVASAKEMIIYIPNDQEKIATLLKSINDKIALNNRVNATLEAMAKTLYDYWFVQFDFPDEKGRPYKTSGGKMVYNEELGREIPAGWEVKKIVTVADLYQPKTISENELILDGQYLVYGANGIIGRYNKYNHESNEVAICCRGASCGQYVMTQPQSWITGNAMVVTPKTNDITKEYLYYSLSTPIISKYITGSAQPQITRSNLELMNIVIPSKELLMNYDDITIKIRKQLQIIFNKNQQLASLRDFLLPMLMNGQVGFRVK